MIIDPEHHWHKDDMPDEEPRPGITEPDYDEHTDNDRPLNREDREERHAIAQAFWDDEDVPF